MSQDSHSQSQSRSENLYSSANRKRKSDILRSTENSTRRYSFACSASANAVGGASHVLQKHTRASTTTINAVRTHSRSAALQSHRSPNLLDFPADIVSCVISFLRLNEAGVFFRSCSSVHSLVSTLLFAMYHEVDAEKWMQSISARHQHAALQCDTEKINAPLAHLRWKLRSFYNVRLDVLAAGVLPSSLQQVKFESSFNHPLTAGVLPSYLRQLTFGWDFNQPLADGVLPSSLQQLTFGQKFNQPLAAGVLPSSLQQLTFGWDFNHPLSVCVLPSTLQQLIFGSDFNQLLAVGVLPSSLRQLTFGWDFNQPLAGGVLPSSLQQLTFGDHFDQPLSVSVLPSSLLQLTFGSDFNQTLPVGVLPSTLQQLTFGSGFNQPLAVGVLPSSLQQLIVGAHFKHRLADDVVPSRCIVSFCY